MHVDDVVADLDADVGVGLQIPVPAGVLVGAGARGEYKVSVTVGEVHHDAGSRRPGAGADGVQKHDWRTLEGAADAPVVGAELGDIPLVEIVAIAHCDLLTSFMVAAPTCHGCGAFQAPGT